MLAGMITVVSSQLLQKHPRADHSGLGTADIRTFIVVVVVAYAVVADPESRAEHA